MPVENGHPPIVSVPFIAPSPLGVEVMSVEHLEAIAPPGYLARPQRPEFHLLMWVQHGAGRHDVDFRSFGLVAGDVLWVRPGQVQLFHPEALPPGQLILFTPELLAAGTQAAALAQDRFGPTLWRARAGSVRRAVEHLRSEVAAASRTAQPTARQFELARHLLSALVLVIGEEPVTDESRGDVDAAFVAFRAAVERDFRIHHDVDHYARSLGWSTRTLARAAQRAAGLSAKQLIDRRIALEARRLLAFTDLTVARVADELGFDDPSNFATFFARTTSVSPTTFRRQNS